MAANSNIEWTDSTVNFWWGCTKVGPGCDHCYAETMAERFPKSRRLWSSAAPRLKIESAADTLQKLNRNHDKFFAKHGRRQRVFIQSMSDLFDNEVPADWFLEAWEHIFEAKNLDIQIVTKRISAVEKRLTSLTSKPWPAHAGLVITVCNQAEADRDVPRLLALKAKLNIPWVGLSIEPLLGPVDLSIFHRPPSDIDMSLLGRDKVKYYWINGLTGQRGVEFKDGGVFEAHDDFGDSIDWVIVGGESGPNARPMHPDWVRSLRGQCDAANVPFFFKQWGEWMPIGQTDATGKIDNIVAAKYDFDKVSASWKLGKARAGRLLDGVEHNAMPSSIAKKPSNSLPNTPL
jgi:protein gp37